MIESRKHRDLLQSITQFQHSQKSPMKNFFTTIFMSSLCACFCTMSLAQAADVWKPAVEIKTATIEKTLVQLKDKEPTTLRQPTILAYKTALFLATGATDTATCGKSQSISAAFVGGEENFSSVVVTVEFMGYADDSLTGERFVIHLKMGEKQVWDITKITRSAFGRGDSK